MLHLRIQSVIIVLLPWVLVCLASHESLSYLEYTETKNDFSFQYERTYTKWKKEKTFALYDNSTHHSPTLFQERLIFPSFQYFIPSDQISFNIPVLNKFHYSSTLENSLSNLLYANLRVKKLLMEYKELQQRARKLMKNPAEVKEETPALNESAESTIFNDSKKLTWEFYSPKMNVKDLTIDDEAMAALANQLLPNYTTALDSSLSRSPYEKSPVIDTPQGPVFDSNQQDPWVITFVFNIWQYAINNKIETVIYLALVILITRFFASVLRNSKGQQD